MTTIIKHLGFPPSNGKPSNELRTMGLYVLLAISLILSVAGPLIPFFYRSIFSGSAVGQALADGMPYMSIVCICLSIFLFMWLTRPQPGASGWWRMPICFLYLQFIVVYIFRHQIVSMMTLGVLLSIAYSAIESLTRGVFMDKKNRYLVSALTAHVLVAALWLVSESLEARLGLWTLTNSAPYYLPVAICAILFIALSPLDWSKHKNYRLFYISLLHILLLSAAFSNIFTEMPAMKSLPILTGIAAMLFWILTRSFRVSTLLGSFVTLTMFGLLWLNVDAIALWLSAVHFTGITNCLVYYLTPGCEQWRWGPSGP